MKLKHLNDDPSVHGIIVQMPLDSDNKIDSHLITDSVCPEKDVDGLVAFTCNLCTVAINIITAVTYLMLFQVEYYK